MKQENSIFDEDAVILELKHYLPAQAPLKDFIHHNTLHAFQHLKFNTAIRNASEMLGYKVSLSMAEYRTLYHEQRINPAILDKVIRERKAESNVDEWKTNLLTGSFDEHALPRIGKLRSNWKKLFQIDLDSMVHPMLFRVICSFLDQGIAIWNFPARHKGFLASLKTMERKSYTSFFKGDRAKHLLLNTNCRISDLLRLVVREESLYKHYLFDQQFAHQGWSGMVSTVEDYPETLLDKRKISLHDLIVFELLLEIDALDSHFGEIWSPLGIRINHPPIDLFGEIKPTVKNDALSIWQEAFEWSYYDQVLAGMKMIKPGHRVSGQKSFQVLFCIDDRESSFQRYLVENDPDCETFATPGFFNVEFYFQPQSGKFYSKQCPAPITPEFLVKETGISAERESDPHFNKQTHSFHSGWLISQTLGFWAAFKLFLNIFRPAMSPATASSFRHMDQNLKLTIENKDPTDRENGLQIGFTIREMADRVGSLLFSIGMIKDFASLVYVIGHGSSSVNNPHFAAYDCGACSGRPGSVNARVFCFMANHPGVRALLKTRGLFIPDNTQFVGALHDTTRDDISFFDEESLPGENMEKHEKNKLVFSKSLDLNSKERSRRFESINTKLSPRRIHKLVQRRSVSLFEPRPELNHATNALCIIGPGNLSRDLFLDRRAFLNSYDCRIDPDGKYLLQILRAAAPVCGGINLEYYFSRVDNQKLGAGTKLPHNVMGLFGVANGIEGDLRPGLPSQMIEVHDPIRLLMIVEHHQAVVLETIKRSEETYQWFINDWIHLVVIDPDTKNLYLFRDGTFNDYEPITRQLEIVPDISPLIESHQENIPVHLIR